MSGSALDDFSVEVVNDAFGTPLAGYTIALEAWRRGLRVRLLDSQIRRYFISDSTRSIKFDKARPSLTTSGAINVTKSKFKTSAHLRDAGVPVPMSRIVDPEEPGATEVLAREAGALGYPVVLKPLLGSMGRDVYTNIQTEADLLESYRYLTQDGRRSQKYVLEEHFAGEDYRVLVVGDRLTAVCQRRPANVVGDGQSSIKDLIAHKNGQRSGNPYLSAKPIKVDREVLHLLANQDLKVDSVVPAGQRVMLRGKANASQGGDSIDRTDDIPDVVKDAAVKAVAAIPGLFMAGVDIIYDASRTPVEDSFRVIELNSRPEIEINMYPWEGEGRDAPRDIIDQLFTETERSSDPLLESVALNVDTLLAPLRAGTVEEVLVKRKPNHNYPCRWRFEVANAGNLSSRERRQLLMFSRQTGVAGEVATAPDGDYLVVCGLEEDVHAFVRKARAVLGVKSGTESSWAGVVRQGFAVDGAQD